MTVYNLYIFNKRGALLYYGEWNRWKHSGISQEEEAKLMYGSLFSLKSFVSKISPWDLKEGFQCYKTNKYKLTMFETPTGLKFIMNTDVNAPNVRELLQIIYAQVFVEYVVKNPLCSTQEPIISELFKSKLDEVVKTSPASVSKG
ncbi:unnamed protein product [Darwinula stevensoni]|uniref:Trafficking protein particle complex subunit n=1 Tax=Darwinula stevensoni TaxID=69355 RepID=A0A7R9FQ78_9CRUS|nr:unnamed protein product [Darwinula stevensoni]CAG0898723.1 unnamed protein product [Darwinula stevensoni]